MSFEIVPYREANAADFYTLNIEWLKTHFYVEPYDEEVLSHPNKYIIEKGGHIFFAILDDIVVGTVALMPIFDEGTFELTKMAVSPNYRGQNIGQQLMRFSLEFAKSNAFKRLLLYSSRTLENAIYIYRKFGFIEIPVEPDCPYERCDIKMEFPL